MTEATTVDPDLAQLQRRALIVSVAAFVLCAVGAVMNPVQFYQSYLVGYLFWIGFLSAASASSCCTISSVAAGDSSSAARWNRACGPCR